ncbi:MAG TPA: hypothetical protein VK698_05880 [Kofleriaceae bacterium]|nr:hypothetical protein [Kofleriaceae bacterium]
MKVLLSLLFLAAACAPAAAPADPTHPASAGAPTGRLAGPPPSFADAPRAADLPPAAPAPAGAHHHHHGQSQGRGAPPPAPRAPRPAPTGKP